MICSGLLQGSPCSLNMVVSGFTVGEQVAMSKYLPAEEPRLAALRARPLPLPLGGPPGGSPSPPLSLLSPARSMCTGLPGAWPLPVPANAITYNLYGYLGYQQPMFLTSIIWAKRSLLDQPFRDENPIQYGTGLLGGLCLCQQTRSVAQTTVEPCM